LAAVALLCAGTAFSSGRALADGPKVAIEGGPDLSAQNYEWVVTNQAQAAISQIEFPHYGATLFFVPDGWKFECSNLVNVGAGTKPGVCRATAARPGAAIAPGDSRSFRMQCAARSSVPGRAAVAVHFADGARIDVPGVSVPQKEPISDRYLPVIGLGLIAAIFLLFRAMARRNKAPADEGL
jgi:hypothetical protein